MRPYVIINCAISLDGKLALKTRRQTKISSEEDLRRVHKLRNSVDAILVGIGTVLADDPSLRVKEEYVEGPIKKPLRVVLDYHCRIPRKAKILQGDQKTIVYVGPGNAKEIEGAEVVEVSGTEGRLDLNKVLEDLYARGVRRLLVEGGGEVIWSFVSSRNFDEIYVFIGSVIIGGRNAPTMADGEGAKSENEIVKLELREVRTIPGGVLLHYLRGE